MNRAAIYHFLITSATGLGMVLGLGGCYVPGGGWTLRTGVDVRTGHKPAAFLEMVDTRWDEWNRVAQWNQMAATGFQPGMESGTSSMMPVPAENSVTPSAAKSANTAGPLLPREPETVAGLAEDIPAPPSAALRRSRDRYRRMETAGYQARSNRSQLVPAASRRDLPPPVIRDQYFEDRNAILEDRGPFTADLPESVPPPPRRRSTSLPREEAPATQDDLDYRRSLAPRNSGQYRQATTPHVRANRPLSQDRLTSRGQAASTPETAWLFARP